MQQRGKGAAALLLMNHRTELLLLLALYGIRRKIDPGCVCILEDAVWFAELRRTVP